MSSPKRPVILSPEARDDYADVQSYTLQTYGTAQWEKYEGRIAEVLDLLAAHPHIGSARDDLPPHYRVFPVEQHRIIFFVTEDAVRVVRILHSRMDTRRHL
jgi:toxin ParE1/3/4